MNLSNYMENLKVLIVEDNVINQKITSKYLVKFGLHADIAVNGVEGVKAWEKNTHDLIFMDLQMPEMDGFEATHEIRLREKGKNIGPLL